MNFRYVYSMRKVLVSLLEGPLITPFLYKENALHFLPPLFPNPYNLLPILPLSSPGHRRCAA